MDDGVRTDAIDTGRERIRRGEIELLQGEARGGEGTRQIAATAGAKVVEARYPMPAGEELIGGVTADETGGTGQKNVGHEIENCAKMLAKVVVQAKVAQGFRKPSYRKISYDDSETCAGGDHGWWSWHAVAPADFGALQTGGAARGKIPAGRHPHQQLPQQRHQPDVSPDAVSDRVIAPPRAEHVSL